MVHQHFMLVPVMTVTENIVLGEEPRRGVLLDVREGARKVQELSERYGLAVDPEAVIEQVSVGDAAAGGDPARRSTATPAS